MIRIDFRNEELSWNFFDNMNCVAFIIHSIFSCIVSLLLVSNIVQLCYIYVKLSFDFAVIITTENMVDTVVNMHKLSHIPESPCHNVQLFSNPLNQSSHSSQ